MSPAERHAADDAAAEWLVKHDRGLTPEEQDAFLHWLSARPEHRDVFAEHRRMWKDFNGLAQWRPEHSAEPNPDLLARPRRGSGWRWKAAAALGMAAVLALAFWRPGAWQAAREPVAFEAASYREETLPDGSMVHLNRGAHLVVQFSETERRVLLVQGEAQFDVAKNRRRPFVVRAGGVDVRAVGTMFNVKLAGSRLDVLVTEGKVQLAQQPARPAEEQAAPGPAAVLAELSAGERTQLALAPAEAEQRPEAPVVAIATPQEIEALLEWKPRLLDFDAVPLERVVETFNRYHATQLVIADEELKALPIVASIRSDNVSGFVRLLEATMGVRAERRSGEILLSRAK